MPALPLTRTPGDLLTAALGAPPDLIPPALDPSGRHLWPRRIAARLGLPATPYQRPHGAGPAPVPEDAVAVLADARAEHLVVALVGASGTQDGFAHAAAVFALARRARLHLARDEDAALAAVRSAGPRFVTLAGPPGLLRFSLVTRLRSLHPRVELGLLFARTPGRLSELVLKTVLYPRFPAASDVLLAPLLKGAEPLHRGPLTVYPQDTAEAGAFARPLPEAEHDGEAAGGDGGGRLLRLFGIITHGSEDYLRLGSRDLLCGRTTDPGELAAARRESAGLPACMHGDTCVYPEARRWDPESIPAQVVFANACLTLKLGTQLFGTRNRFGVAQRFLDAWAGTYIASPLLKDGTHGENLLFQYLIEEGATVAGAVRQVNEGLRRWGIDAPEVLVVGDPEARYAAEGRGPLPDAVTCREEPGRARIGFEGVMPAFTRVPLKDPELREAHRAGRLEITALTPFGGKLPVYGTVGESAGGELHAYVFGFGERRLTGTQTSRTLSVAPREPGAAGRIVRAVERYENLASLGIRLDKARSVLADTANSLPAVARRTRTLRSELTESEPLRRATDRILAHCARLDRDLLATLLRLTETREYHFVEAYRPAYGVERVESPFGVCGYCGETTHRYTSAHVLRPALRRLLVSCPVCGATQDTEDGTVHLAVEGEPVLVPGGETRLVLRITNDGTEDLDVLLGARITHGKPQGFGFALDPDELRVPAGGTARTALTVTTGRPAVRHGMLLRCYAVGLGRIDFAGRDLRFGPPAG